jgi:dephospho-CoA kinase
MTTVMHDAIMMQQELVHDPRFLDSFKGITIYGVAGTNGSGKDSLMNMLVQRHGFLLFNTSNSLRQIAQAVLNSIDRGGNDAPLGRVGNAFRTAYPGGMVELGLLDWWMRVGALPKDLKPNGLVLGSIRGTGEAKRLKEVGGKLIVVDADPHVRYGRLSGRGRADDKITFEQFLEKEAGDMAVGETDPTKFGMAAVIDMADIRIENNGNDIEAFKDQADEALGLQ